MKGLYLIGKLILVLAYTPVFLLGAILYVLGGWMLNVGNLMLEPEKANESTQLHQ